MFRIRLLFSSSCSCHYLRRELFQSQRTVLPCGCRLRKMGDKSPCLYGLPFRKNIIRVQAVEQVKISAFITEDQDTFDFISLIIYRIIHVKSNEAVEFAKGLVNFSGRNCRHCEKETVKSQFAGNLRELTEMLMEPCENLLLECHWNGEPFQCCRHFQRIQTESGPCFSLNSAHSK